MTPLHKKTDFEKTFLYLMLRGHIWPLVARKRQEKGFSGPQNKVLHICWPPEAKMTPSQKTQKIPILNIIF